MSNEIDLHGFQVMEAMEAFVNFYNKRVSKGDLRNINVIHGYGANGCGGKILPRLRSFLVRHSDKVSFIAGEDVSPVNPGRTIVIPKKSLPASLDVLGAEILAFCQLPKTRSKIAGKFHRLGESRVKEALVDLEKKGLLCSFSKGKHKVFQATELT